MNIGVWCPNPDKKFPNGRKDIGKRMKKLASAGINFYAPFLYNTEMPPIYNSSLIDNTKRDLLTPILEEAKRYGIKVHPVVLPFHWNYQCDLGGNKEEIAKRTYQPAEKVSLNLQRRLCASWEENANVAMEIIEDLVKNYDLIGIHLDAIRYIDTGISIDIERPAICLCQNCRKFYKRNIGKEIITGKDFKKPGVAYQFIKLRANRIKDLLKRIRKFTKGKGLELSIAARANYFQSAIVEGQEWVDWAREGLVDIICTMNYSLNNRVHREKAKEHVKFIGRKVELFDGISRSSSIGEISSETMITQIKDAIEIGVDGVMLFHKNCLTDEDIKKLTDFRNICEAKK